MQILHACDESDEAFISCKAVLSQLNEDIPDVIDMYRLSVMIKETGMSLSKISDEDLLQMKNLDGVHEITLKFYTLMVSMFPWAAVSFFMPVLIHQFSNLFISVHKDMHCILEKSSNDAMVS